MFDWLGDSVVWKLSVAGAAFFVVALLVLPLLAVRLPADYLLRRSAHELRWDTRQRVRRSLKLIGRNVAGWLLMVVGLPFVVLPGPGITMVFIGALLADYPGKRRAIFWLLTRGAVHHGINWVRDRARREPLIVPGESR